MLPTTLTGVFGITKAHASLCCNAWNSSYIAHTGSAKSWETYIGSKGLKMPVLDLVIMECLVGGDAGKLRGSEWWDIGDAFDEEIWERECSE